MKKLFIAFTLAALTSGPLLAQSGAMAERQQARVQELIGILEISDAQEAGFRDAMTRVQAMQREAMRERAGDGNRRGAMAARAGERAQQGENRGDRGERMAQMTAEERAERREQMQAQAQERSRMMARQGEIDTILSEVLTEEQLSRFHAEQARMAQQQGGQMRERGQGQGRGQRD